MGTPEIVAAMSGNSFSHSGRAACPGLRRGPRSRHRQGPRGKRELWDFRKTRILYGFVSMCSYVLSARSAGFSGNNSIFGAKRRKILEICDFGGRGLGKRELKLCLALRTRNKNWSLHSVRIRTRNKNWKLHFVQLLLLLLHKYKKYSSKISYKCT